MKVGLDNTVTTLYFMYRYSTVKENLLLSYLISFVLVATLNAFLPAEQIVQALFVVPYTYLFLITRLDQTSGISSFYQVMGVSSLAQIVAKLLLLQLLINTQLIFLLLLSTLTSIGGISTRSLEVSSLIFVYVILAITYWRYCLLLTVLAAVFIPLSYLLLWSDILPNLLIFNSSCILLLLILISDSYED